MEIVRITSLGEMDAVREDWESAYASDPHANIFVSWPWLRSFFQATSHQWLVLAFKSQSHSRYSAFLPLSVQKSSLNLIYTLHTGGFPLADYTGFVCEPGYEKQALPAFARYIQHDLGWDRFRVRDLLDPRVELLFQAFAAEKIQYEHAAPLPSPYITLPESWDLYLQNCVGYRTRRNLRKNERKLKRLDGFRHTFAQAEDVDVHIEALLTLWQARWNTDVVGRRALLHHCFQQGRLWLQVYWQAKTPIAASAGFPDEVKGTFSDYMGGFNPDYARFSPGNVLIADSIQHAIKHGFQTYDFLRGDEAYKFSFGAENRFTKSVVITRRSIKNRMIHHAKNFNQFRKKISADS